MINKTSLPLISNLTRHILTITFGICLFLTQSLNGQESNEASLLWKVEGPDIKTSYVYGTFHLLPQADFELKEKVKKAFESSEELVLELDMDDPAMQLEVLKYANMKDGGTLDKLLSEENFQKLDSAMKEVMGVGVRLMNSFKPFVITSVITASFIDGTPASFEGTFVEMAQKREMEVLGLETVQQQMDVFDRIPYESQAEELMELINDPNDARSQFSQMLDMYYSEDIDRMYRVTSEYMDDDNEVDVLLNERNKNWIPLIGKMAKEKSLFIGVGAGHLGGPEGVVNLLKKAGYKLTPIH